MIEKTELVLKKQHERNLRPLISFFVTAISLLVIFAIENISPFGTRTFFMSDLAAQYAPNLIGLKNHLTAGGSLLYSFELGMGKNVCGTLAYYLSSPFNLITFLFPSEMIQEAVVTLVIMKLSTASALMTWLLDCKFEAKRNISILFGLMYALCSFCVTFMFNIMWLDGIALLPLVILTLEALVKNAKKWPFFVLTLFILFVSGYYMAYMVGAFSFLYFIGLLWFHGDFGRGKGRDTLRKFGLFIGGAITAAMMSAILLIPAGLDTIMNKDYTESNISLDGNFPLVRFVDQFFVTGAPSLSNNLPFIFCGLSVLILCILFFFNQSISKKLRGGVGLGFLLMLLSFHFPPLDIAWHLFDDPNWFAYRYSYIASFIMIAVAFYSFLHLSACRKKDFIITGLIIIGMAAISQSFGRMKDENSAFYPTLAFVLVEMVILYGLTKEKWPEMISNLRKYASGFLVAVIFVEVVILNPRLIMPNVWGSQDGRDLLANDIESGNVFSQVIDDADQGFYRLGADVSFKGDIESCNYGIYANQPTFGYFASMSNKPMHHLLKQFGYSVNYNYFAISHLTPNPVADALFGVRFFASTNEKLGDLSCIAENNGSYLYENENALPLLYPVDCAVMDFDAYSLETDTVNKDYFDYQEQYIEALTGKDATSLYNESRLLWEDWTIENAYVSSLPFDELVSESTIVDQLGLERTVEDEYEINTIGRCNAEMPMVLKTTIVSSSNQPLLLSIPFPSRNDEYELYLNGEFFAEGSSSYYSQVFMLGCFIEGEEVNIEIRCDNDTFAAFSPQIAYLDSALLSELLTPLSSGITSLSVENGSVDATIQVSDNQVVMTSIPYEKGWTLEVDGEETDIQSYADAFIVIPVSAGTHDISLRFTSPGYKVGAIASGIGVVVFLAGVVLCSKKKQEKSTAEE